MACKPWQAKTPRPIATPEIQFGVKMHDSPDCFTVDFVDDTTLLSLVDGCVDAKINKQQKKSQLFF